MSNQEERARRATSDETPSAKVEDEVLAWFLADGSSPADHDYTFTLHYFSGGLSRRIRCNDACQLDGPQEWWYANGQLKLRIHYKNGRYDGPYERWYSSGQLMERTHYKEGQQDGLCEWWHENGRLMERTHHKNGRNEGLYEWWYANGQLSSRRHYKDDRLDGLQERWYENGQLKSRVHYKAGQEDGLYEEWDAEGHLWVRDVYEEGDKVYPDIFFFFPDRPSQIAFRHYQPVRIDETGWVQLGLDGRTRLFAEDPSHIRDEVNAIAREMAPALEMRLKLIDEDPTKYIRVKAMSSEERTQRSQLTHAETEELSRGRKL